MLLAACISPYPTFYGNGFSLSGHRELTMSNFFKQTAVRIALQALRGLSALGRGLLVFSRAIFWRPLGWSARWTFRLFLLPLYSRYVKIKQRLKYHPRLAGIRSISHFATRYAIYISLIVLGVFGVTANLFARTVRPDEVGQGALWSTFAQGDALVIVETGAGQVAAASGIALAAVGGPGLVSPLVGSSNSEVDDSLLASTELIPAVGGATASLTQRRTVETYTVEGGDTVSTIAESFGLSARTLLWANGLGEGDFIKPGQVLKIPSVSGYLYTVRSGDTLTSLAQKYKGKEDEILEANGLPLAEALQVGQDIIIPGGEPPAPPTPVRTFLAAGPATVSFNAPPSIAGNGARFIWPTTSRRINQYFRGRWHTGLDIDGDYGTPIYASAGGRVTYASSSRNGYGLHVVVDHGNGYTTLYAHASKIFVGAGQSVSQGQTIAVQGCTGRCTGVHVHYEIRLRGGALNPLSFY